ncbi:DNA polymerase (family 10) [Desulfohalotomaculum tongense]|uniref:DNA polymerase/3'-5' exonuclease PolX n=1 Tax=Desulforadius tongensis TaxID=1216062 RepID=UPI00195F1A0E|nr:DNA polymerase (family 10) [Desulforadius tongensis]
MKNVQVAWVFYEMADLLEIKGADFFKIRAYRNAAKAISRLEKPVEELVRQGLLNKIPGIGKAISAKTEEILETGTCRAYQQLLEQVPRGLLEVRLLPGIGPKKARTLFQELGITSLEELEKAARERRVRKLPGMSAKTEFEILRSIQGLKTGRKEIVLGLARDLGSELVEYLSTLPAVKKVELGGSTRRWKETVSDLDIIAAAEDAGEVLSALASHPRVTEVLRREENRIQVLTWWGVEVDLTVVPPEQFITAWHRSTGSRKHYQHLTRLAESKGFKLDHRALITPGGRRLDVHSEADIYTHLGLEYIPPELREDNGEIEAAETGSLPRLVELEDIKGDLHTHTTWSDAAASLEEMAAGAKKKGYSYMAVTDHSGSLKIANGLSAERLLKQVKEIEKLNEQQRDFTVLTGVECDILADGRLDHPDDLLAQLDVVVASVHTGFKQDKETMTNRIIAAIENEHVDIIGHVSGRLLGRRGGYELDMERVLEAAAKYDTVMEINSSPDRLDLSEENARLAKELGVKVAINTDAHDLKRLNEMEYGVAVARRAWLTPDDVVNTMDVEDLMKKLK